MAAIWAAAIGAVASVASANINKNKGGAAGQGGFFSEISPNADGKTTQAMFDNSGWNVSFGDNSPITSTAQKTASQSAIPNSMDGLGSSGGGYVPVAPGFGLDGNLMPYLVWGAVALIVIKIIKKKA